MDVLAHNLKSDKPLAIAVMGPTAAGKTDLAIALKDCLNAELISVDSALVYKGMDIGTAKPSADELKRAPHKLIDIRDPAESYSVADFCNDAKREIEGIVQQGKTPLLVGGTMLYFNALLNGLSDMPASDGEVRQQIERDAIVKGWPAIHEQLAEIDPEIAATIHPNHSQRICRALEVYLVSGKTMSEYRRQSGDGLLNSFNWVQIAVSPLDRSILHQRIESRFDKMLELGLVEEVRSLYERKDLNPDLPAIRAVGYRQVWAFLAGECSYAEMRDKGIAATRQLAKRQLTWLRKWPELNWVYTQTKAGKMLLPDEILNTALNCMNRRTI